MFARSSFRFIRHLDKDTNSRVERSHPRNLRTLCRRVRLLACDWVRRGCISSAEVSNMWRNRLKFRVEIHSECKSFTKLPTVLRSVISRGFDLGWIRIWRQKSDFHLFCPVSITTGYSYIFLPSKPRGFSFFDYDSGPLSLLCPILYTSPTFFLAHFPFSFFSFRRQCCAPPVLLTTCS
jgi:hypothetical protein